MHSKRPRLFLAALLAACISLLAFTAPANAAPTPPPRDNSVDEPVYLIHGFDTSIVTRKLGRGWNCDGYWGDAETALKAWGWTGPIRTYGYYATDRDCDVNYVERNPEAPPGGDRDTPLLDIARHLAEDIYKNYSSKGKSVDVLAHSMGGLIIQSALTEVSKGNPGFPPYLYVEDVVTLSSPHAGTLTGLACDFPLVRFGQCKEMRPNSVFLQNQIQNPQSTQGTDWTTVGSDSDVVVRPGSATSMPVNHKVIYDSGQRINHQFIHRTTEGAYQMRYLNTPNTQWTHVDNGASPVRVASNALYWHKAW